MRNLVYVPSGEVAHGKVQAGLNCKHLCVSDFGEFDQGCHPQKMRACKMMRQTRLRLKTTQMETNHICFFNPSNDTPGLYPQ